MSERCKGPLCRIVSDAWRRGCVIPSEVFESTVASHGYIR
jgi:hypothetical protein